MGVQHVTKCNYFFIYMNIVSFFNYYYFFRHDFYLFAITVTKVIAVKLKHE